MIGKGSMLSRSKVNGSGLSSQKPYSTWDGGAALADEQREREQERGLGAARLAGLVHPQARGCRGSQGGRMDVYGESSFHRSALLLLPALRSCSRSCPHEKQGGDVIKVPDAGLQPRADTLQRLDVCQRTEGMV